MGKVEDVAAAATISEDNSASPVEIEQSTVQELSLESVSYSWTLSDFPQCRKFRKTRFISPTFAYYDTDVSLHLYVTTENDRVNIYYALDNESRIECPLHFMCKISVEGDDCKVISQDKEVYVTKFMNKAVYNERASEGTYPEYRLMSFNCESDALPEKLTVHCEFSPLTPIEEEMDANQIVSNYPWDIIYRFFDCLLAEHILRPSVSRRARRSMSRSALRQEREIRYLEEQHINIGLSAIFTSMLLALIIITVLMSIYFAATGEHMFNLGKNQDADSIPATNASEINQLIFDSTKKLNLIAEALNLTSVKEKSLEILAVYSKMYNSTEQIQPVMHSIESNVMKSVASTISAFFASLR